MRLEAVAPARYSPMSGADEREGTPEAVTLEGADDFDAGLFLDIVEDFHVAAETCFVKYETGTWNLRIVEHG